MPRSLLILIILAGNLVWSTFSYAENSTATPTLALTRAVMLSNNCLTCHTGKTPDLSNLNTLKKTSLAVLLLNFKQGQTPATLMGRLAKGYSDEDLRLIADFLGQ